MTNQSANSRLLTRRPGGPSGPAGPSDPVSPYGVVNTFINRAQRSHTFTALLHCVIQLVSQRIARQVARIIVQAFTLGNGIACVSNEAESCLKSSQ